MNTGENIKPEHSTLAEVLIFAPELNEYDCSNSSTDLSICQFKILAKRFKGAGSIQREV